MRPSNLRDLLSLVSILVAVLVANSAIAAEFVFGSGSQGGYYHEVANELVGLLKRERESARNQASGGSAQNLLQLATPSHAVNVVLAQADAVRFFLDEHPDFWSELVVVEDLGRECASLITSATQGIESAKDLQAGGFGTLVTPGMGSGAAVTFEYMSRMNPNYRNTAVVYRKPMDAMRQIRATGEGRIAAIMLVGRPDLLTPEIERVLEDPAQYRIAPIRAEEVENGALPDGSSVYSFEEVEIRSRSGESLRYETMCTRALLLTSSSKLDEATREKLARSVVQWRMKNDHAGE